jgi:hypothetical protein
MADIGPIPTEPLDGRDTDPEPFGPKEATHEADTVKRCVKCGQEIGGNTEAFQRGAWYALNCAYWYLRTSPRLGEAAATALVTKIRDELGF